MDVLKCNIAIIWTLVFDWYVIRCGSNNGQQINMSLKEIGLYMQTILCSKVNIIRRGGGVWDHLMNMTIFTLILRGIHMSSRFYEEDGYGHDLNLLIVRYRCILEVSANR